MERITDKLRKLLALAERGCGGEAENAKRLLEVRLRRYGMTFATEVGNTFAVPDITERYGYIFDGWYADEALTVEFDFAAVAENTEGVDIWAKWVVDESIPPETTATTQPPETTVTEPTSSEETSVSQTTDTDVVTENPGDNVWLIVIVAAAVIAAVAIIYILFHKKQKITK